jgi:hypothetical protein
VSDLKRALASERGRQLLGVILGGAGGLTYALTIGCRSGGACPLISNPVAATMLGALMGFLILRRDPPPARVRPSAPAPNRPTGTEPRPVGSGGAGSPDSST